jgi:hypothetical protein
MVAFPRPRLVLGSGCGTRRFVVERDAVGRENGLSHGRTPPFPPLGGTDPRDGGALEPHRTTVIKRTVVVQYRTVMLAVRPLVR